MRGSFGSGGGIGGGGGAGNMIRIAQRAIRDGVGGKTISHTDRRRNQNFNNKPSTSPKTALILSSSASAAGGASEGGSYNDGPSTFSSLIKFPVSAAPGAGAPPWVANEDSEWECVDGSEDGRASVIYEDFVFGTVPSKDEVQLAVSALQQLGSSSYTIMHNGKADEDAGKATADEVTNLIGFERRISNAESEMDWIEPPLRLCNSGMLLPHVSDRVYDALHLLQTDPSVQRMVISLSSDKAVWDAVLNNDVVKELRGSISQADSKVVESLDEGSDDPNPLNDVLGWIILNAKAKIMELVDQISRLLSPVIQPPNEEKTGGTADTWEEKLKTSLLLSVFVLIIVVMARAQSA